MTALIRYEAARQALADARLIDEVKAVVLLSDRMKLYARQAKDREMMANAVDIRLRAERELGVMLKAAKDAGQLGKGRPKKAAEPDDENGQTPDHFPRATLEEAGIDKYLSSIAQKRASISQQAFELMVQTTRERLLSDRAKVVENMPGGGAAVAHNRVEPGTSADFFPTPPWATRALVEHVLKHLRRDGQCKFQTAWEPACGHGHMAEPLGEYFKKVYASDLHPYGYGDAGVDFLTTKLDGFDWIITNPPFDDVTEKFVLRALELDVTGVAMFVRLQWLETTGRYERIFSKTPPSQVAIFSERVPIHKGRWDPEGDTLTAYIWLLWIKGMPPQPPFWIPPGCSKALTRPDDVARFTQVPVQRRGPPPAEDAA